MILPHSRAWHVSAINQHLPTAFAICLCGDWILCYCLTADLQYALKGVRVENEALCAPGKLVEQVLKSLDIWRTDFMIPILQFSSVQFSCSVVSDSLRPHESQHTRPPCPSLTPRVHSDSCALSWWCHSAISFSAIPFSSCPQSLAASGSFPMSQHFTWGGQSSGVSALASFLPKNTQDWSL